VSGHIRISEIFGPTIQGEGPLIGRPSVFVRTAGCDYRCTWCDTAFAVLPEYREQWSLLTPAEIIARVNDLTGRSPVLVTLSGGNPALQPLAPVIALGRRDGHGFALETQGSVAQPWFADLDWLIVSPKPPSSEMATDWTKIEACLEAAGERVRRVLKIVIFDDADYIYARTAAKHFPKLPVYLQVGNPVSLNAPASPSVEPDIGALMGRLRWLAGRVAVDRWFEAVVLPQLHVLAWGNKRGV
jgi:7-carboxy-7-deazaguanine synthase